MDLAAAHRRRWYPGGPRITRHLVSLVALVALGACAEVPNEPLLGDVAAKPAFNDTPLHQVFMSGSHVDTWNAIVPVQDPNWATSICIPQPAVGLGAAWTNPHKAFVANGAAFQTHSNVSGTFTADWINAWPGFEWFGLTSQYGGPPGSLQQSWTRYSTPVSGNGDFVLYLAADNCSWIYLTDELGGNPQLVGVQLQDPRNAGVDITYPVTLSGNHRLEFLVFDGGGQSGGMFKLETNTNVVFSDTDSDGLADVAETNIHGTNPNDPDTDDDGVNDGDEVAAGTDPLTSEVTDSDGDGVDDDADNCPAISNASQADYDNDGAGDACDSDIDGDGADNGADAFPYDEAEWADTDGDGYGDNADAFDNSNIGPALMVGTCNTGVANWHIGNGTWANDLIASAYASAANHGAFVRAVTNLSNGWKKAGQITGREHGAIVSCAARTK